MARNMADVSLAPIGPGKRRQVKANERGGTGSVVARVNGSR
jgi:hypothetical protein